MNFDDMRMVIQLDRSYKEGVLNIDPRFSTPHFITMLIEKGYISNDNELPVLRELIIISNENLDILTDFIKGKRYRLPIEFVSKTVYNYDSVSLGWLCSKLRSIAHVLVEYYISSIFCKMKNVGCCEWS